MKIKAFAVLFLLLLTAIPANAQSIRKVYAGGTAAAGDATYTLAQGQEALNDVQPGEVLYFQNGITFISPATGFVIRMKSCPAANDTCYYTVTGGIDSNGDIIADSNYPANGTRIGPAYESVLPKFQASGNNAPAIRTVWPGEVGNGCTAAPCRADFFRLKRLEVKPFGPWYGGAMVVLGTNNATADVTAGNNQNISSEIPHHIILDQMYIHGDAVHGQNRCMTNAAKHTFVLNSYIGDCKSLQETQAISVINTTGPQTYINNFIEGTGESFMTGGGDGYGQFNATILASPAPTVTSAHLSNCEELGTSANKRPFSIEIAGVEYMRMIDTIDTSTCQITWTQALPSLPDQPGDADNVHWSWAFGGLTFELNKVTKNVLWRDAIVATPVVTATPTSGGTLAAGVNNYRVVARIAVTNGGVAQSLWTSDIVANTTSSLNSVLLAWPAITGAQDYQIHWRVGSTSRFIATVTSPTYTHTSPTAGTAEAATPQNAIVTPGTGGTLTGAAGTGTTYRYRITALPLANAPTEELACFIAAGVTNGRCSFSWTASTSATSYRVWGRSAAQTLYFCALGTCGSATTTTGTTWIDDGGTVANSGNPSLATHVASDIFNPTQATVWVVKNTFELKGCDGLSDGGPCSIRWNIFENSWKQGQTGMVINIKVNNQSGSEDSTILRNTTFESNIIRNGTRAFQICMADCGDSRAGAGVGSDVAIRNNLIYGIGTDWGEFQSAIFLTAAHHASYLNRGAARMTFDHNAIFFTPSLTAYGPFLGEGASTTAPLYTWEDLKWTNNVTSKGNNGWHAIFNGSFGTGGEGTTAWNNLATGAGRSMENNIHADATCASYPDTVKNCPTSAALQANYIDYNACIAGDIDSCAFNPASPYNNAGTDGTDIGPDIAALMLGTDIAESGNNSGFNAAPIVNAGANIGVVLPSSASLAGTASDDSLPSPPALVTTMWSKVSGPGTVTFGNAAALVTTASFSAIGTYELRLTASDSLLTSTDDVTVTVTSTATAPPVFLSKMDANTDSAITSITTNAGTISGVNKYIACALVISGITRTGTSITINDTAETLTKRLTLDRDGGGGATIRTEYWDLVAPSNSTGTTTVTAVYSAVGPVTLGCVVYTGVHQASPYSSLFYTSSVSATSSTVNVTDDALNKLVVDFAGVRLDDPVTMTETVGQTVRVERIGTNNGNVSIGISEKAGGATTAMTWTSDDAVTKSWAHIAVAINGAGPANTAPVVSANIDQSITLPATATLDGTVTDDGQPDPPATVTTTWSKISGPGAVSFGDTSLVDTIATFGEPGTYVLQLLADDSLLSASDQITINVAPEVAYVKVEAEDYQTGGEGVGYHDSDSINQGGAYRPADGVDIQVTTDEGGGYNVGFTVATEWLEYDVVVPVTGTYTLQFRVASDGTAGTFHLEVDNVDVTGTMSPNNTGDWQLYETLIETGVSLTEGAHVFRIEMDTTGDSGAIANFNWFDMTLVPSANGAPTVSAGTDSTITLPAGVTLDGTVSDDGLPEPPSLSQIWTKTSGPGTVTFVDAALVDTTATFSLPGTYVVRLTVSDSDLSAFDEKTVTVNPVPNNAPTVNAGPDAATTMPAGVNLDATASDDGVPNPPATLTYAWTKTSGPGTAVFVNAALQDTIVTFSEAGTYVLRLTVSDSALTAFDELTVTVVVQPPTSNTVRAERFVLNSGNCAVRSGTGPPAALNGCDLYVDASNGRVYGQSARLGTVTSPGDLTLDPIGNNVLPALPYDINLGSPILKLNSVYGAELNFETLVAVDKIATIGGRVMVGEGNILTATLAADVSATTIVVKYNNFIPGDPIRMEANGQSEHMTIMSSATGTAGSYNYTVTRDVDGSGPNLWNAGDAIVATNRFIDIYSERGVKSALELGPSLVGNIRTGAAYNAWEPRWVLGGLSGLFGYTNTDCDGSPCFGAAFGSPSSAWVKIDPTFGVRIGHGVTTKISLDPAGNALFDGTITSTAGNIGGLTLSNNALSAGTGTSRVVLSPTGIWLGNTTLSTAPFSVTPQGLLTATNAVITGSITATSGNVLGAIAAGSLTADYIAAGAITADKLAVGAITAGSIDVTGLTENMIKNGRFEGLTTEDRISGWFEDAHTSAGVKMSISCCGKDGPNTLFLNPGTGFYTSASYKAVPVQWGEAYRIGLWVYTGVPTTGLYVRLHEYNGTGTPSHVVNATPSGSQVVFSTITDVCNNCALPGGWSYKEFAYTVPVGVNWVSLDILNFTFAATYADMHIDGVEMLKQIGNGHIKARSILASSIAADQLTAFEIAANAITVSELAADSVTSAKIVAGTIVASDIAADTITASQIATFNLSAISANLGTITAGSISGVTITAGGTVTLNSSGISVDVGFLGAHGYKFGTGEGMYHSGVRLVFQDSGGEFDFDGTELYSLGNGSNGTIGAASLTGVGDRAVCANASGVLVICFSGSASIRKGWKAYEAFEVLPSRRRNPLFANIRH